MYTNRYVCTVLDEMRKTIDAVEYGMSKDTYKRYVNHHRLLIEEAQTMVNRMEEALEDAKDVRRMKKQRSDLHKEIKKLKEERAALNEDDASPPRSLEQLMEDLKDGQE